MLSAGIWVLAPKVSTKPHRGIGSKTQFRQNLVSGMVHVAEPNRVVKISFVGWHSFLLDFGHGIEVKKAKRPHRSWRGRSSGKEHLSELANGVDHVNCLLASYDGSLRSGDLESCTHER
jgi:hypothetical protein